MEELARLVEHITDRLSGAEDGSLVSFEILL